MSTKVVNLASTLASDTFFSASSSLGFLSASLPADGCGSCTRPVGACVALAGADEVAFSAVLYPGILRAAFPAGAPATLRDLLHNPVHAGLCKAVAEGAVERARSALVGASRSAVAAGEAAMPVAAARSLWPKVFSDAFAAQLPVAAFAKAGGGVKAEESPDIASPFAAAAAAPSSTLIHTALGGVVNVGVGGAPGWPFRGGADANEWTVLVAADAHRLSRDEPSAWASTPLGGEAEAFGGSGALSVRLSWAWLDVHRASLDYPALAEIAMKLAALPYEINRKATKARLHSSPAATLLIRRWECDWAAGSGPSATPEGIASALTSYATGNAFLRDAGGAAVTTSTTTTTTETATAAATTTPAALKNDVATPGANYNPKLTAVYMVGEIEPSGSLGDNLPLPPFLILQVAPAAGASPVAFDLCAGGNRLLLYRSRDALTRTFATCPSRAPPGGIARSRSAFAISLAFGGDGDDW